MFAAISGCEVAVVGMGPVTFGTGMVSARPGFCAPALAAIINVIVIPATNIFIVASPLFFDRIVCSAYHDPPFKGRAQMKNNRGFSLLELLIVVAIILIIATIAIPSLLRSRQAANESAAVANLRTINTAQVTYLSSAAGNYGTVSNLMAAGLIDSRFSGPVSGYSFTVTASGSDYTAFALPTSVNSGRYGYFSLPDAVVYYGSSVVTNCNPCFPSGQSGRPVQ
jgi:prepilin-type N-terminal cleavage/methylation domain-containing protein